MAKRWANSRVWIPLLAVVPVLIVAGAALPIFETEEDPQSVEITEHGQKKGRGRGVTQKRGAGQAFAKEPRGAKRRSIFEMWKARRAESVAAAGLTPKKITDPRVPIGPGAVGRNSVVLNDANQILFSKHFPGT